LQERRIPGREPPPILYYAFDLLNLNGRDLTGMPLTERKRMLEDLVAPIPEVVRFSAGIEADSDRLLQAMKARGLEGVVAKRRDSKYQPGRRSGAWLKFKWSLEQEFVIGGCTPPRGTRAHFGAIFVGYYSGSRLLFASKVGSGYDHSILESLHKQFKPLEQSRCPFADLPSKRQQQGRQGVTAAEMLRCTWLKPRLVAQIRFAEWTRDGHLRQPVFLGLREDKDPKEVGKELPK
jgi:bifunctional non-homologous end joining protein LigD